MIDRLDALQDVCNKVKEFVMPKKLNMYDEAIKMFEYIEESPSGKVKRKGGDFGGTIEGRIVTCKGVFYIKQHTMFADDLIDIKPGEDYDKNF